MRGALAALVFSLAACGGKTVAYEYLANAGGAPASGGVSSTGKGGISGVAVGGGSAAGSAGKPSSAGGEPSSDGGASGGGASSDGGQAGSSGGSAGATSGGGVSEVAGASGAAGNAGAGGRACASVSECPRPANACVIARCAAGSCITENAPAGALFALDVPADCHATTACDGLGHPTLEIDQDNAPVPNNPCLVGTCNSAGLVGSEPLPRGTRCGLELIGAGKCDGKGSCVPCLVNADCPLGQTCSNHQACVGTPCSELNCGGACPACLGKKCALGSDCASHLCDPVSRVCVRAPQCSNARQDGNETDTDCGGGTCAGCAVGQGCLADRDCGSFACDALSLSCVADPCADHHRDSDETDVDCGGSRPSCVRCGPGQQCNSNFDCVPGHYCPQVPNQCQ
jgi:hypothetical protein